MSIKTLPLIFIFTLIVSIFPYKIVFAQTENTPYQDYLFNYSRYQAELNKLTTAKAAYKKDASLQNLTNLIETTKTTYLTIGDTMIAYNNFLQTEVVNTNVVPQETMSFFNTTLSTVNTWYIDQKSTINSNQPDLKTMQATINTYHKAHEPILLKVNQLRLIANSARIAKFQDEAKILLAKLFTYINSNVSTPDPRQEIWRAQIIEKVDNTNLLIKQNFELIPQVNKLTGGNQANSQIVKNAKAAIENINKTASYLNEINNTL